MLTEGRVRAIAAQVALAIAKKIKPSVSEEQIRSDVEAVLRAMKEAGELEGGTVTDEQIEAAVEKYLTEHPLESPEAEKAAESAKKSAEDAESSASVAKASADEAGESARTAEQSASSADESASLAASSAEAAAANAERAGTANTAAERAASDALEHKEAVEKAKNEVEQKLANGDYKGKDGLDGYTPVPGIDYPTDAQIDAKIAAALAERNQLEPLVAESVTWLNENGDPTKVYIVPNTDGQGGKVYAYAEKTIVTEPEQPETPADVNVLEGMTLRVGRYGSTGTWTSTGSYVNNRTTELIECDDDDRITIENWLGGNTSMYISLFDASQAWIGKLNLVRNETTNQFSTAVTTANSWADKANYPYSATTATSKPLSEALGKTGIAYFTVCSSDATVDSNNQAINGYAIYVNKGSGSSTITHSEPTIEIVPDWYVFTDFVPTDDARIDELNRAVSVLDTANAALNRRVDALEENGVTSGGATSISKAQALLKIRNWDKPIYERLTPFLLDEDLTVDTTYPKTYTDSADSDGSKRRVNVQKVYDEYNALCTAHPDFVRDITDMKHGLLGATETTFGGLCSDGIQYVRVYEFCERAGRHSNTTVADNWSETKPTFVIVTGIHWEYNGVYSMLYALKEITENPELRDMRRNCRFIVIPMSNPYSFTAYQASGGGHYNANGVEIHNNFAVDFNNAIDATHGTAPLTEVETRYIDNALRKYRDTAVCLLSCHSNASKGANFIWGSVATKFMCNVSMRLVDMMSNAWDVKYDGTDGNYNYRELIDQNKGNGSNPQDDGDYRCGFASLSTSSGTEAKQATLYGVQGINVEVYEWFYPFDPNGGNKLLAYSRGAETYINLLRLLAVTYDRNDRDKYAPTPSYEIDEGS